MLGWAGQVEKMLRYRLTPVLYSPELTDAVVDARHPAGRNRRAHQGRYRHAPHRVLAGRAPSPSWNSLRAAPNLRVAGLMTHFAWPTIRTEDEFSLRQIARFEEVVAAADRLGLTDLICHAAATAATLRFPNSHFDMVRIGLGLYGLHPSPATSARADLVPAIGLVSRIVEILDIDEARAGGLRPNLRPRAPVERGWPSVPAGYHDGVPRALSNVGDVIVAGVSCPIAGIVSMDSMTIDVTNCPDRPAVGSDVLIYGAQGEHNVALEEVAGPSAPSPTSS